SNPSDERFRAGAGRAGQDTRKEETSQPPAAPLRRPLVEPQRTLTFALIAASVLLTVMFHSPNETEIVCKHFFITEVHRSGDDSLSWIPARGLAELRRGELWRLVTPVFIHFTVAHILFNMLWLFGLGTQLELRYGTSRLALLFLLIAVPSNLCQYFLSTVTLDGMRLVTQPSPFFGGMSG